MRDDVFKRRRDVTRLRLLGWYFLPVLLAFLSLAALPGQACAAGAETHFAGFVRGDANDDGLVDFTDALTIFRFLWLGDVPEPPCMDAADVDDSGVVDFTDGQYILNYLFQGTLPSPPAPHSAKGFDPTADELGCRGEVAQGNLVYEGEPASFQLAPGFPVYSAEVHDTLLMSRSRGFLVGSIDVIFEDGRWNEVAMARNTIVLTDDTGIEIDLLRHDPKHFFVDGWLVDASVVLDLFSLELAAGTPLDDMSPTSRALLGYVILAETMTFTDHVQAVLQSELAAAVSPHPPGGYDVGWFITAVSAVGAAVLSADWEVGAPYLFADCSAGGTRSIAGLTFLCSPLVEALEADSFATLEDTQEWIVEHVWGSTN